MRENRKTLLLVLGLLLLGPPVVAGGEIRTFAMEGTVDSLANPLGLFDFVHLHDRVIYTFAFDSDAPDLSSLPNSGVYQGLWSTLQVGGQQIATGLPGMTIGVGATDGFGVESQFTFQGYLGSLYFRLRDYDGAAIADPSIPTAAYSLSLFETREFSVTVLGPPIPPSTYPSEHQFYGPIDAFYVIPEPCAGLLAALGGLFVASNHRRSRRQTLGRVRCADRIPAIQDAPHSGPYRTEILGVFSGACAPFASFIRRPSYKTAH